MNTNLTIDPLPINVGGNIEQIRNFKKKSIKEIAGALKLSVSGYRNIERGITDISISKLFKIAFILDVHFSQIFEIDYYTIEKKKNTGTESVNKNKQLQELHNLRLQQYRKENTFLKKQIEVLEKIISNSHSQYFDIIKTNAVFNKKKHE